MIIKVMNGRDREIEGGRGRQRGGRREREREKERKRESVREKEREREGERQRETTAIALREYVNMQHVFLMTPQYASDTALIAAIQLGMERFRMSNKVIMYIP